MNNTSPQPEPSRPWRASRALKFLVADGLAFGAGLVLSLAIRFDFELPPDCLAALPQLLTWVISGKLLMFYCFRQFHILPDYFGVRDLRRLAMAAAYASLVAGLVAWESLVGYSPPSTVFVIDFLSSLFFLAGLRLALRFRRERMRRSPARADKHSRRIGIIGAGEAGAILCREIRANSEIGLHPVAFFDDNPRKWDADLYDIPILGSPEVLLTHAARKLRLDEVVISMPSAPAQRIRQIIAIVQQANLPFRTVPSLTELAVGKFQVSQLRSVEVEDLLGRAPVELSTDAIHGLLNGRTVMVTGAGGSVGSELCRQISGYSPADLILVERSEAAMFSIEQELLARKLPVRVHPLVVDIRDEPLLRDVFEKFRPQFVFHAAAHKHVPMMESQPGEAIRNNTLGTALLAEIAIDFGVERFVLISTDKAINPTSVMGATKRLAEVFLQSVHAANSHVTRLMAVRFGNVLGSSGSVIPIFKKQIAEGGPVTVTDPEMTRYFMTIPEAVGLVLQSAVQGQGGEVFVLDMGKPVKIVDLARQLIELSGLEPDRDIAIEFVGLRPGEKLFEELNLGHESLSETQHPKIRRLKASPQPLAAVQKVLCQLAEVSYAADADELKYLLKQAVPEYTPCLGLKHPPPVLPAVHMQNIAADLHKRRIDSAPV